LKCDKSPSILDTNGSALVLLCMIAACPGGTLETDSEAPATSVTSFPTDSGATSTGSTTNETSTTSDASSSTSGPELCGNGVPDPGEACDDGNEMNGDGCNKDCAPSGKNLWTYTKDGGMADIAEGVRHSGDTIVVVGSTAVDGQSFNGWVARLDLDGGLLWETSVDEGGTERFHALGVSSDGSFVAVGAQGKDDKNIWVRGYSKEGELQWSDDLDSGFGDDFARNVAVSSTDEFAVAGILSVDGGASAIWSRRYDTTGKILATSTQPIEIAASWSQGPGVDFDEPNAQIIVSFATKYGDSYSEMLAGFPYSGGGAEWTYESSVTGIFHDVLVAEGGLLVSSYTPDLGFTVSRRDALGAELWRTDECTGTVGRALAVDAQDQSIVAIGQGDGDVGRNIRICKFTPEGSLLWGDDVDSGLGDDRGWSVDILDSGVIVAAGDIMGADARTDGWVAAYSP